MNKVKKLLCLCTAFLLMAGATSCNNKKKNDVKPQSPGTSASSDNKTENASKNAVTEYFDATQLDFGNQIDIMSMGLIESTNEKIYFMAPQSQEGCEYSLKSINTDDMSSQDYQADSKLYSGQAPYISGGKIYSVTDDRKTGKNTICVGNADTGAVEHEAEWEQQSRLIGIRTDKDGNIYVMSCGFLAIYKKDLKDPEIINLFELTKDTDVSNTYAYAFEVSPDGEVYLVFHKKEMGDTRICKLNAKHTIEYITDDFSDIQDDIQGLFLSDNGNLLLCSGYYPAYINEISPATGDTVYRYEVENAQEIYGLYGRKLICSNENGIFSYNLDTDESVQISSIDDPSRELINVIIDGNTLKTASKINADMGQCLYISDTDGKIEKEIPIKGTTNYEANVFFDISSDGQIYYLGVSHGTGSENGDFYETTGYAVYTINSDDQCEKLFDIPTANCDQQCYSFFRNPAQNFCICKPDKSGKCTVCTVYTYDSSGNLISALPISDDSGGYLHSVVPCGNKMLFFYYNHNNDSCIATLNTETMQFEPEIKLDRSIQIEGRLIKGNNGFDFYYNNGTCMYGYTLATNESKEIIEWVNTDLSVHPENCIVIDPETIICKGTDYSGSSNGDEEYCTFITYKFDKADEERLKQINSRKIITLAGTDITNSQTGYKIKEFNRTNEEYRIQANDYSKYTIYSDSYFSGSEQLDKDLIAGNIPDIIILDRYSDPNPYLVKEMFVDLGKFIDDDKDINRDDYLSNILDMYTYKNCLYQIVPAFIDYTIVSKTSLAGDKPAWTYDEFFDFISSKPDTPKFDEFFDGSLHFDMLLSAYIKEHVDLKNNTCDFDNEKFIKLLEFINTLKSNVNNEDLTPKYFRNSDILMSLRHFDSVQEYHEFQDVNSGESITFKGFPSESGISKIVTSQMGFSISEKSENKDGAWQFIRQFLLEDYQDNIKNDNPGWPIKKSSLQKYIDKKPSDDDPYAPSPTVWVNDEGSQLQPITEEAKQKFMDYLQSPGALLSTNSKIMKIINEESSLFFNGESTSAEVAKAIQSKVKLYICELN